MFRQNKDTSLTSDELDAIRREISMYENKRAVSIEALKIVQKYRGWVDDYIIRDIAKVLGITESEVESVATFYNQIFRKPVGRHVIRYCDSVVCYITGYEKIKSFLEKKLQIIVGHTSYGGRFTLLPTCCLGNCDKGPVIMINNDTYVNVTPEIINNILKEYP